MTKMRKNRLQRFLKQITAILFICSIFFTVHSTLLTVNSFAEIPKLINYQGRLMDSQGRPLQGIYKMIFRIYDAGSGGTLLWESIYDPSLTGSRGVSIDKGIFNEMLGEFNNGNGTIREFRNLSFDRQYWLGIQVGGDPEMSPRQPLASSAYAFRAENADKANTLTNPQLLVPQGAIILWRGSSCPQGYRRVSDLDGKFLVGGSSYNANAGGSNTHIHNITAVTTSRGGTQDVGPALPGPNSNQGGYYIAGDFSIHKANTPPNYSIDYLSGVTANSADNRPAYATILLCEKE
jgi:hypothetical protein